jgi:hypothetical protein
MAGPTGFEPAIFSVTGRRDRPTSLRARIFIDQRILSNYLCLCNGLLSVKMIEFRDVPK